MKTIKKIEKDTVLETIGTKISLVAPRNTWIVVNEDGSFFLHKEMGYMMNKAKSICQLYADAENAN